MHMRTGCISIQRAEVCGAYREQGEKSFWRQEDLFGAIYDYSRYLYAVIYPDKTQNPFIAFFELVLADCPYTIKPYYLDKGREY